MDAKRIIQAAIPGASDEIVDWVIWERTPYPFAVPSPKELYKIASQFRRAGKNRITLCDFCDNRAKAGVSICERCDDLMKKCH